MVIGWIAPENRDRGNVELARSKVTAKTLQGYQLVDQVNVACAVLKVFGNDIKIPVPWILLRWDSEQYTEYVLSKVLTRSLLTLVVQ